MRQRFLRKQAIAPRLAASFAGDSKRKPKRNLHRRDQTQRRCRGIFANGEAIVRLVGAILTEQNYEWAVQRARWVTLQTIAAISDNPIVIPPVVAA